VVSGYEGRGDVLVRAVVQTKETKRHAVELRRVKFQRRAAAQALTVFPAGRQMSKGRGPRKPRAPQPQPQSQPTTELPAPRSAAVVRAEPPPRLTLVDFLETCRAAVLSLLDLADAAAEAIKRRTGPGSA
jgi:hypothetical protein